MTNKYVLIFAWLFAVCSVSGQTDEYRKINLSVHAGMDFPLGTSNTAGLDPDFMLPFSKGFGATFDGAYYFTKNFGAGLKYHFFTTNVAESQYFPPDKAVAYDFKEMTHYMGPAFFGKWMLGTSNWEISSNASIGYVHNKIFKHAEAVIYMPFTDQILQLVESDPDKQTKYFSYYDWTSHSIGLMFSAGIRYRIIPAIGIGINASGMFSGAKKQKFENYLGEQITLDNPRKMNRFGISAGLDFSF